MKFSVLLPSYKEKRVYHLCEKILKEKVRDFELDKIVVVAYPDAKLPKSEKILFIRERERKGKYYALREGLKKINSKIIVLLSADLNMRRGFLQNLLKYFKDEKIGMIVGRPMADRSSKIYPFAKIIWDLHHLLCLKEPKGTEICAFRKTFNHFPKVSADEVFIEYKIRKAGFSVIYEPRACGYTRIPYSLAHLFKQRKRCFIGHLFIQRKYGFTTSSVKLRNLLDLLIHYIEDVKDADKLLKILIIIQFELLARIAALFEFLLFKNKEIVWEKVS